METRCRSAQGWATMSSLIRTVEMSLSQTPYLLGGGVPPGHCRRRDGCPGWEKLVKVLGEHK